MYSNDLYHNFELKCRECLMSISAVDDMSHKLLRDIEFTNGGLVNDSLANIVDYASKVSKSFDVCLATHKYKQVNKIGEK